MRQQHRVWWGSGRAALVIAGLLLGTVGLWQAAPGAQGVQGTSTLTGRVTADKGEVRALRVQARDAGRGIVYTVFTTEGQYRILNLPAGTYEVQVVEGTFDSPVQRMTLAVGQTGTVNLAIAQKADAGSQYTQIVNSRSASLGAVNATAELVEFDELYPPGPGRDLLIAECTGCHGPGWHRLEGRTAEQWAKGLERMFINDSGGQHYARKIVGPGAMSAVEKQALITYLATAFGPNYKPTKDLRLDPIVRDEEALSRAIFIQYELPPMADPEEAKARGLRRGTHDVFPASEPGKIWMAGFFSSSVVQVDVNNPDIEARTKEWDIPSDTPRGARPHGIVESHGYVYWTAQNDDYIGAMNIKTGEMQRFPGTPYGGPHTLRADSKGNIFWTEAAGIGQLGRLDARTRKVTLYDVKKNANWYGIVVDQQDQVWAAGLSRHSLAKYDPATDRWTLYSPPQNLRRLTVDSQGNIWGNSYFGNSEIMFDPKTETFTEYRLPLKYGNPYEGWADNDDNVWLEVAAYNSLAKLDAKTKRYTYYPMPNLGAHTPKMETGPDGTLWFGMSGTLTNFMPTGNVP